jgi:protein phosphatase-4 regulatory subunit 3
LILDIIYETMPRDNLLNSACLEFFDYIKRDNCKPFVIHVVEKYREKLEKINFVETFHHLILRYDQMQGYGVDSDLPLFRRQDEGSTPRRMPLNGGRWQGVREMDAAEEEYFNTSDDEEEWTPDTHALAVGPPNGAASPAVKSLVDYPDDDDDDDVMDTKPEDLTEQAQSAQPLYVGDVPAETATSPASSTTQTPPAPERLAEKRRREEEDEDELIKLAAGPKRRSSTASNSSAGSLRRKNGLSTGKATGEKGAALGNATGSASAKKIAINLGQTLKSSVENETPDTETAANESNEKENNDSRGDKGG